MPDYRNAAEVPGPDGEYPRVTRAATVGHQIRIIVLDGDSRLRVTCLCQIGQPVPWTPLASREDTRTWRKYNNLPHDPDAGTFSPVDETTGLPVGASV